MVAVDALQGAELILTGDPAFLRTVKHIRYISRKFRFFVLFKTLQLTACDRE